MAKSSIVQLVERRLAEIKLGAVEAAERVPRLERNYIRDLIIGKKMSFSQAKMSLVAQALDWTLPELMDALGYAAPAKLERRRSRVREIPIIDYVQAGKLIAPSSQIPQEEAHTLSISDLGPGEWFALKVQGTSMDRVSPEGSIIIVNKNDRALSSGLSYVFAVDGEVTFKRWQEGPPPYLESYSTDPLHKPKFFKKRDLDVIGRVRKTVLDL